jgi:hypothetical protein
MKPNLFTTLICLAMGMSTPSLLAADKAAPKETAVVIAEGVGINADKALRSAWRNAVQQVVGVIVDAETLIKNDKVVKDEILDFSNGFVEKFEKIKEGKNDDGLYEVTIKATIKRRRLIEKLKQTKVMASVKVDGGSLFAEALSKNEAEIKGAKLLEKALLDLGLPGSLMSAGILDQKPKIVGRDTTSIKAQWTILVKFDLDKYKKTVFPKLNQVLSDICLKKIGRLTQDPESRNIGSYVQNYPDYQLWQHMENDYRSFDHEELKNAVVVYLLVDYKPDTGRQIYHGFFVDKEAAEIFREYQLQELGSTSGTISIWAESRKVEPKFAFALPAVKGEIHLKSTRSATLEIRLLDAKGESLEEEEINMLGSKGSNSDLPENVSVFPFSGNEFLVETDTVYNHWYYQRLNWPLIYGSHYKRTSKSGDNLRGQYVIAPFFVGRVGDPSRERLKTECYYVWIPTLKLETANKVREITAEIKLK